MPAGARVGVPSLFPCPPGVDSRSAPREISQRRVQRYLPPIPSHQRSAMDRQRRLVVPLTFRESRACRGPAPRRSHPIERASVRVERGEPLSRADGGSGSNAPGNRPLEALQFIPIPLALPHGRCDLPPRRIPQVKRASVRAGTTIFPPLREGTRSTRSFAAKSSLFPPTRRRRLLAALGSRRRWTR